MTRPPPVPHRAPPGALLCAALALPALAAAGDEWLAAQQNALPIALVQPEQIAEAVAWLVSEAGSFITGTAWPLDAGFILRS